VPGRREKRQIPVAAITMPMIAPVTMTGVEAPSTTSMELLETVMVSRSPKWAAHATPAIPASRTIRTDAMMRAKPARVQKYPMRPPIIAPGTKASAATEGLNTFCTVTVGDPPTCALLKGGVVNAGAYHRGREDTDEEGMECDGLGGA